ncbi:hypothetical protein ACSSS7_002385 [Eimeria intestinalis]
MELFDTGSQADAAGSELKIRPQRGTIGPENSVLIHVQLCLKEEKKFSGSVFYGERTLGSNLEELHFGCVLAGTRKQGVLLLGNDSKYDYSFRWITTAPRSEADAGCISIQPADGIVPKGNVIECVATYSPEAASNTDSLHAVCEVQGKKFYVLLLRGSCRAPKVTFSFTTYDFGSFFLPPKADPTDQFQPPIERNAARVSLRIKNMDPQHECTIASGAEPTGAFHFQPVQACLSPEEMIEVPITFSPREPVQYKAKIPFFVNEHQVASLQLLGRGLPIRLEVQSLGEDQTLNLQPVLRGKGSSRTVSILNRSEKAISFYLEDLEGQLSVSDKTLPRPADSPGLSVRCFREVLHDRVIAGSWTTQDVLLSNIGELPMSFRFANTRQQAGLISINPSQGTLQPRADLAVTMTFHPTKVQLYPL